MSNGIEDLELSEGRYEGVQASEGSLAQIETDLLCQCSLHLFLLVEVWGRARVTAIP